jgi:hypothetical protein
MDRLESLVEARYAHLPRKTRERILAAYKASQERAPDSFLKDYGVDVRSEITSENYKDFLFLPGVAKVSSESSDKVNKED